MRLIKGASLYLTSNILNALIPFLLLPVLTRYLTQEEYGQVAMFQTLLVALATFIGLNSAGAAQRKYFDANKYDEKIHNENILRTFNASCLHICFFSAFVVSVLVWGFRDLLSQYLSIPVSWIMTAVCINVFNFIISLCLNHWQNIQKPVKYGALQMSQSMINMMLSLIFVIVLFQGGAGRIEAQLLASFGAALISVALLYKEQLLRFFSWRPQYIKEALSFGLPLIPHHLGFFLMGVFDRIVVNSKLGLSAAAIYMIAFQFSYAFAILYDAINKAIVPWLFAILERDLLEEKIKVVKLTYLHFGCSLVAAALSFFLGGPVITFVAGAQYQEAGDIIGWLCLGQAFGGMYLMFVNYFFYFKKNKMLASTTLVSGLINVVLLYSLIQFFGIVGAAMAFAISKICQFFLVLLLSRKIVQLPFRLK